jgi:hypothetical protein
VIVELESSTVAEIVFGPRLAALPRWEIKHFAVTVEPFHHGRERESHYRMTIGSGESYGVPYEDGFRFDKDRLGLRSVYFNVPEVNLVAHEFLNGWLGRQSVSGTLRLIRPDSFSLHPTTMRWLQPNGQFLASVNDRVTEDAEDYLRLGIAQDMDLLFADGQLCGWILFNPALYLVELWDEPYATEPDSELIETLRQFLALFDDRHILRMEHRDSSIQQSLIELRERIGGKIKPRSQRAVLLAAVQDVIDRFYGPNEDKGKTRG